MDYKNIVKGIFKSRPNRFIAMVEVEGSIKVCHVKNTGRCKELLVNGAEVYLEKSDNPHRKTLYDLVAVVKNGRLINMDSQAPNAAVKEWLIAKFGNRVKSEKTYGNSRFDFFIESEDKNVKGMYLEVKGVTLEKDNIVMFPDAPTERGVKHLEELIIAKNNGYDATIMFVVQMENVNYFTPNMSTDKVFGNALKKAKASGVNVWCYDCKVTENSMIINNKVAIKL